MPIETTTTRRLEFIGGSSGALTPFFLFLAGVIWLGLGGAPDERGFWPILIASIGLGLALARDRRHYCETLINGMSRPIVMLMILAWLLAGILATLLNASGFIDALVWLARSASVQGGGYVGAAFLICAAVSSATGTSLGTLILCAPLLYSAGGALHAEPAWLMGAILAGATFGDNVSPVSDTTIASATTQNAEMGAVVSSRLRYALPVAALALVGFVLLGGQNGPTMATSVASIDGNPRGLIMLAAPMVAVILLLRRRHLVEGLCAGIATAIVVGLLSGSIGLTQLLYIDRENFIARGLIAEGLEKGVGVSIFTLLLMGLAAGLEETGMVERLIERARTAGQTERAGEGLIFLLTSVAVLLTTHAAVALLMVGPFALRTGERIGLGPCRRANLLDLTVSTWPFLLPYFIPTILAAAMTTSAAADMPHLGPLEIGLHNLHSWGLLAMLLIAMATGYGRRDPGK